MDRYVDHDRECNAEFEPNVYYYDAECKYAQFESYDYYNDAKYKYAKFEFNDVYDGAEYKCTDGKFCAEFERVQSEYFATGGTTASDPDETTGATKTSVTGPDD